MMSLHPEHQSSTAPRVAGSRSVLVVDDDAAFLDMMQIILEDEGYRVFVAASAEEALELLEARSPTVIVADYWMPRLTGLELVVLIAQDDRLRLIPVIMMSEHVLRAENLPCEVAAWLPKPLSTRDLLRTIDEVS